MEDCESSCIDNEQQTLTQTGYLRKTDTSFCMDNCSVYFLENEYGEFLSWITHLDDFEMLNYYNDRFVDIEGDTVQCTECEAINVISIAISDECQIPVYCFVDPCSVSNCYSYPETECVANYCGGCWADYYLDNELIQCGVPEGCIDLTGIDFGLCEMVLGIGWINNHCEYISGCDWVIDSVDYSEAFFDSMDDCQESCIILNSPEFSMLPISYKAHHNYPNPFNASTLIPYTITQPGKVTITILDIIGREVLQLANGHHNVGEYLVKWDGMNRFKLQEDSGIYFYRIQVGRVNNTRKMLLIK